MNTRLTPLLQKLGIQPVEMWPVSGGDINDSYRIEDTEGYNYFLKINRTDVSKSIITTEARGLLMMKQAGVTMLPENIRWAEHSADACLIMDFYQGIKPGDRDWITFFEGLAHMHLLTEETFGGENNFIGTLFQDNSSRNNWIPFFRENRLIPQLEMARSAGYFPDRLDQAWSILMDNLPDIMPIEKPALIHGDLWSGNMLQTERGILLIDPCPYYGHREMDLAMMLLFSGVPLQKYLAVYNAEYPLEKGCKDRVEVYQLYYLLAHLNMFGTAYLPAIERILKKFGA